LNASGVWEWDGGIGALTAHDLEQLLAAIADGNDESCYLRITHSFEISEDIDTPIWVIEDNVVLKISSTFTVNGLLNVAGEIAGATGGKVIIPAGAQIKNVLWGGGWISEEIGTGVLHGLPVDAVNANRIYVWQSDGWVLQP
jgi:hypothetical protein